MTYNCLVADDFDVQRSLLAKFVSRIPNLKLSGSCADGLEAAIMIAKGDIDIVFCDIDMPNLSGIGLLRSLKNPPVFIFITGHSDYAVESYNLDVVDFILKPMMFDRFLKAANKAIDQVNAKAQKLPEQVIEIAAPENDDYFFIKESHGITRLKYSDVLFIESLGDFSKIHTVNNHKHILLSGLKNLESQLPLSIFVRVHKQYIANLNNVLTVTPTELHFINKQTIAVGSSYRKTLLDSFMSKDLIKRKAGN